MTDEFFEDENIDNGGKLKFILRHIKPVAFVKLIFDINSSCLMQNFFVMGLI